MPTEDLCLDTIWAKCEDFASHKWMKSKPDLTCVQASGKETDQLMSGTMLYKHKCLLPNTQQKLQVSCIEIYCASWKMKILFLNLSINAVLIYKSFLPAKSGSLQRKWRHQRLLHIIKSKLQVTPRKPKSIWWDIKEQTSHQARTRRKVNLSSPDHKVTRGIQVITINIKCHPTKRNLILNKLTKEKIDVPSVEIQSI